MHTGYYYVSVFFLLFREEIIMPWGVIGRIIESLAKGISQKTVDEMLTTLKRLVEQPDSH